MFAHTEADVAAGEVAAPQIGRALQVGLVRRRQVAGAAQQRRHLLGQDVEHRARSDARGDTLGRVEKLIHVQRHVEVALQHSAQQLCLLRVDLFVAATQRLPFGHRRRAAPGGLPHEGARLVGDVEGLVGRQPQALLGQPHLLDTQRLSVGLGRSGPVGAAEADGRAAGDERRLLRRLTRRRDSRANGQWIMAIHPLRVPAIGIEALQHVFGERQIRLAVNGDMVVVVEEHKLAQPQMAGQRTRLVGDALHQVAVADQGVGRVVDERKVGPVEARRQPALGDGHADGVG